MVLVVEGSLATTAVAVVGASDPVAMESVEATEVAVMGGTADVGSAPQATATTSATRGETLPSRRLLLPLLISTPLHFLTDPTGLRPMASHWIVVLAVRGMHDADGATITAIGIDMPKFSTRSAMRGPASARPPWMASGTYFCGK